MKKIALVTGGGSGIGQALAQRLAAEGHFVFLAGRNAQKLETTCALIGQAGGRAEALTADLADEASIRQLAAQIKARTPTLDVLVHSAGCFRMGTLESAHIADLDDLYQVNLRAPYLLTQLLYALLLKAAGQIVFINSTAILNPGANWGAYAATKAALRAMADSLRAEINPRGVRVLTVIPGRTDTPMQEQVHQLENRPYQADRLMRPDDVALMTMQALNLPPSAEVTEIVVRPAQKLS
ncbi:MAG: SDR family NAD(P)-dependent oxidoreductase [Lentisphaerae bacterium]|jgi:NAD(P)-dependent dehydrogenase (short-subunit alcohol dehydrogenase family)|nr:SDR family NAD(P)-dependent oxidoreductase [Lentisphaerota bacterium]